jgi:hypothetical protein
MKKLILAMSALIFTSACSSVQLGPSKVPQAKDKSELDRIKAVAIVGLSSSQPSMGIGDVGAKQIAGRDSALYSIGEKLAEHLKKRKGWRVLLSKDASRAAAYESFFLEAKSLSASSGLSGLSNTKKTLEDSIEFSSLEKVSQSRRDDLMTALQVDALLTADAFVTYTGFTIGGYGTRYPQVTLTYKLFRKGSSNPIWSGTSIGKEASESVGFTGFVSGPLVEKGIKESSANAVDTLNL